MERAKLRQSGSNVADRSAALFGDIDTAWKNQNYEYPPGPIALEGYTSTWDFLGIIDSIRGVFNGTTIITQGQSVVCEGAIRELVDSGNLTY